jgi:predicted Rossmann fold flavoprotein
MTCDLLIVGAGPAGLSAAIAAAQGGRRVLVCEHLSAPGRKLLVTGGGRCNLTNTAPPDALLAAFGRHGRFAEPALSAFPPAAIRRWFADAGVPTVAQEDGCVFPQSQRAGDVLDALLAAASSAGARLRCGVNVRRLVVRDRAVAGVETDAGLLETPRVLLAAGGCSYPALGSDGSGFRIAAEAGLAVAPPVPALVPLVTVDDWPRQLAGLVAERAAVRVEAKGRGPAPAIGPLLFTHRGVSGPPVLDLSGEVSGRLSVPSSRAPRVAPVLRIAWRADRDAAAWRQIFAQWRDRRGGRSLHNLLAGELPARLAEALCRQAGAHGVAVARARRETLESLAEWCGDAPLAIEATEGWDRAMVARGGVARDEVDPRTLASRRTKGLFLAGEILDLDGPCGGYNLTWALASGRLAGGKTFA